MWCADHDIPVQRNVHKTSIQPAVSESDRWEARLWALTRELDAEARERTRPKPIDVDSELAAIAAGDAA